MNSRALETTTITTLLEHCASDPLSPPSHTCAPSQQAEMAPPDSARADDLPPARQFDDEWRRWIAENLMLGGLAEILLEMLVANGFRADDAASELDLAQRHPYVRGSELLRNRLAKRDWLLSVYRGLNRLHPVSAAIERRHRLSRQEFLCEYYCTNRPVIITGMMDDWPAMRRWSLGYFAMRFGERTVEVQIGNESGSIDESEKYKRATRMHFAEFLEKVQSAADADGFYLTASNSSANRSALPELWDEIGPISEYLNTDQPGGSFWIGPPGSITPFHHDLTNNLLAQAMGRRLFRLIPSWDMPLARNDIHCFSQVDGRLTEPSAQPASDGFQVLEFVLDPGELLFLPVGWLRHVQGIDPSVTVSFTNFEFDNDFSAEYTTYCRL